MKKIFLIFISILISGFFIFQQSKLFDFNGLKDIFFKLGLGNTIICILLYISSFIIRAYRWKILLEKKGISGLNINYLTKVMLIGYAANNILPLRLGELVRSQVLFSQNNLSRSFSIGSIIVERIFDLIIIGLFLLLGSYINFHNFLIIDKFIFYIIAFVLLICIAVLIEYFSKGFFTKKIMNFLSSLRYYSSIQEFLLSFKQISDINIFLKLLISSFIVWFLEILVLFQILILLGYEQALYISIFTIPILNLSILIPSAPGYFGVFQAGFIFSFSLLNLDLQQSLLTSIYLHSLQYFTVTLLGVYFFYTLNIFSKINKGILNYVKEKK